MKIAAAELIQLRRIGHREYLVTRPIAPDTAEPLITRAAEAVKALNDLGLVVRLVQAVQASGRPDELQRRVDRGDVAWVAGDDGCPRSLAQVATLTSTMSAVRVAAHRAPTRSAILVSSGTTDVFDALSRRAIRA